MAPKRKAKMGGPQPERPPKRNSRRIQRTDSAAARPAKEEEPEETEAMTPSAAAEPSNETSDIDMPDASQPPYSTRSNTNDEEFETAPENQSGTQSQDVPSEDESQEPGNNKEEDDEEQEEEEEEEEDVEVGGDNNNDNRGGNQNDEMPDGWEPWMAMTYSEYRAQVAAYTAIQNQQIAREVNAVERATARAASAPKPNPAAATTTAPPSQNQQSARTAIAPNRRRVVATPQQQRQQQPLDVPPRTSSAPQAIPSRRPGQSMTYDPVTEQPIIPASTAPSMSTPNLRQGGNQGRQAGPVNTSRFASLFASDSDLQTAIEAIRSSDSYFATRQRSSALNLPIGRAPPLTNTPTTAQLGNTTTNAPSSSASASTALTNALRNPGVSSTAGLGSASNTSQRPPHTNPLVRRSRSIPPAENMTPEMAAHYDPTMRFSEASQMCECTIPLSYSTRNPNIIPLSTTDPFFNRFPGAGILDGRPDTRETQRTTHYDLPRDWWQQFGGMRFLGRRYQEYLDYDDDDDEDDEE